MTRFSTYRILFSLIAIGTFLFPATSVAETTLGGELGIDLRNFGFSNVVKGRDDKLEVNRSFSSHFLNLDLSGPIVNSNLANYVTRAQIYGTYYDATSNGDSRDLYIEPDLNGFFGQVTMFPERRYPLQLYRSRSRDYTLRYETNNRTDVEIIQPALAVLRRYEGERSSRGAVSRVALSEQVTLLSEYKTDKSEILRNYDYNEDKDIWAMITTGLPDPLAETHALNIKNEIPDAAVRVFIGSRINVLLDPGEEIDINADSGSQEVSIIPLTYYNQYRFRIEVRSDMNWKIVYNEPATPRDQDQTNTTASFGLRIDGGQKYLNEAHYEYLDQKESFQNLTTFMGNFSNNGIWNLSQVSSLNFLTTASRNRTIVDTSSSQLDKSFMHMSTFNYSPRRGLSGSFSHTYSNNLSNTGVDELTSDMNAFVNTIKIPSDRFNHRLDIKNSASLLSDNTGYENDLYSTVITNRVALSLLGIYLKPRNEFKYSINPQGNPFTTTDIVSVPSESDPTVMELDTTTMTEIRHKTSKEVETKFFLDGEVVGAGLFGDIDFTASYEYRNKFDDLGSNTKQKYRIDIAMSRRFGKKYRMMLMTVQELETYGGSTPTPGANVNQDIIAKASEHSVTYRIDFQLAPVPNIAMTANYMLIKQETAQIKKAGFSLTGSLPLINVPIKSFALREIRQLEGLPDQTQFSIITKLSYRFRQITLVMSHTYATENQIANRFAYHQIEGKITRRFSVL